jgi:hypothetical protein
LIGLLFTFFEAVITVDIISPSFADFTVYAASRSST